MPRFEFELEAVLRMRSIAERSAQRALAELEAKRVELEARIKSVQGRLIGQRQTLRETLAPNPDTQTRIVPVADIRLESVAALHGIVELKRLAIEMAGLLRKVDAARTTLKQAAIAKKSVEMLKTKRKAEFRRHQSLRESLELDDLSVMRAGREDSGAETIAIAPSTASSRNQTGES